MPKDIWDDSNEVKTTTVSWGKVGDNIQGTLVGAREVETTFGPRVLFEVKADTGVFHDGDVKTEISQDEVWGVWGKDQILTSSLQRLKFGQKVGLKFVEEKKSKFGNPAKIVKVFTTGEMDKEWLEGQEVTPEDIPS